MTSRQFLMYPVTADLTPDNPDAAWLRDLLARHGVSQRAAAGLIRVDDTTVRRWLSPITASQHRKIPWAYARALVAELAALARPQQ